MTRALLRTLRACVALTGTLALSCAHRAHEPGAHATVPPVPSALAQQPSAPPETPPDVRTTPHPAVATVIAALSHDERRDEATCRAVTGFAEPGFERCAPTLLANGTAVSVRRVVRLR